MNVAHQIVQVVGEDFVGRVLHSYRLEHGAGEATRSPAQ